MNSVKQIISSVKDFHVVNGLVTKVEGLGCDTHNIDKYYDGSDGLLIPTLVKDANQNSFKSGSRLAKRYEHCYRECHVGLGRSA
jgi:hypothetical protein